METVHHDIQQNTDDWLRLRRGKFTCSVFSSLFAGKQTAEYKKAVLKVVYERLTYESPDDFKSEYMKRGNELEGEAIYSYMRQTFNKVNPGGFFEVSEWIGGSPDGLIGSLGLIQVKCPAWNTMMEYMQTEKIPNDYLIQVQGEMMVSERSWCDLVFYHPKLGIKITTINRDEYIISDIKSELETAIAKSSQILETIKQSSR